MTQDKFKLSFDSNEEIGVKIEKHNFSSSLVACFWKCAENQWEGTIPKDFSNLLVRVLKSENFILILEEDEKKSL